MTKRTTEQQRARELQRTAHKQGTRLSYHEALNWVRETAQAQAEYPGQIVVFAPHAGIVIFDADEDPEFIRANITPTPAAEVELANELLQRRDALMRDRSKAEIIAMILRRRRYDPGENLARWTKQELANELVDGEDGRERYEAYGRVALHNGKPMSGSRSLCGGVGCFGHDNATPWPETRARFRAQGPCIDAQ
ncbi:hypothetical protein M271_00015 [Streptomyces rapamycinicus NRRL 5491]|uniref:Uncharacterized protein n=2 Tax=Streptomyces rapamycinicus TaxID=1226757 RepID=A0A0A0N5M7_STRRN|nr:hypothetical protein [Streptomyces rapamycinicus]AGP51644.1 hypothetical protein M271_00015 [Streptomyces rapamycinicus NRRL 5491]MBB4779041.1 hypothetical protein [Streptomyces rapamycinicus]MBB4787233.1 hypothetical protein [Streptomyces rapamycinicus]RLV76283.1 hypothetical protein D3C57_143695 [Streptomyces rapamycinicus NRRL 5491]